ncbi:MAG: S9 family peptidase, partial [Myxococcota bacterium]
MTLTVTACRASAPPCAAPRAPEVAVSYPTTRRDATVDTYHGRQVADAYRWLEDPDSPETSAWVQAQNEVTSRYLAQFPTRSAVRARLAAVWDYEKYGVPVRRGARIFFTYNPALLNQSPLYVIDAPGARERLLLDPNTLSSDGTVSLNSIEISADGALVAYAISRSGSDWQEWLVRDVASGRDLDDHLTWSKFSGASFDESHAGFYYSAYDPPVSGATALTGANYYHKLYYHRLGTSQQDDRLVYERRDEKEWGFEGRVTDDGHYLIIHVSRGTDPKNALFYLDLTRADAKVTPLLAKFDASYTFVGNQGSRLFLRTDAEAPLGRLVAVDIKAPARSAWVAIIPEASETLESVTYVGGRLIARYLADAHAEVRIFSLAGTLERRVPLPGLGSVAGFEGLAAESETYFSFTSFARPAALYRLEVASGTVTPFREPRLSFDPASFETEQVFLASKDGTRLPMFLSHKKGIVPSPCTPTYLYGYGGFDISITPWFSPSHLAWMQLGGVLAVATLRGGG